MVLFDRFPLPEVYDVMDGPIIDPKWGAICASLARIERKLYKSILWPDSVIILDVSPEIALSRKPEHNPQRVRAKSAVLEKLQGQLDPRVSRVDAGAPLDTVLLQVRRIVWRRL